MRIAAVPPIRYLGTDSRGTCTLAGFALKLPRWWARQDLNLGLLPPSSQSWPGSRVRCAGAWRAARASAWTCC